MRRNVGTADRVARTLGGLAMIACAAFAPLSLKVRLVAFGATGIYLLFSALAATCFGYHALGKSTCAVDPRA